MRQHLVRPPPGSSPGFILPRPRSCGFGSCTSDSRRFHTLPLRLRADCFRFGYRVTPLNLATDTHSLALYPKGTLQRCAKHFHAATHRNYRVSGSFHTLFRGSFQFSFTVLVRYRSQRVFRIGGCCPPYSQSNSKP